MSKKMSIIIPTYNRADSLPKVLSKLFSQQEMPKELEIIVIDDGSTDATKEIVKEFIRNYSVNIRYLYQTNTGAAAARNRGIKEALGEIILFLDSDIIPSEELISEHLKFHERYPWGNFALRGNVKFYSGQSEIIRFTEFDEARETSQKDRGAEYIELCWADFRSGNSSLKRRFLIKNGLFDEKMSAYQDMELGYRLEKHNLKLFHSNKALGFHFHPADLEQYFSYAEKYGRSLAVWHSKAPNLKKDLLKIANGYRFGSLTWKKPLLMCKYYLKVVIVSKFTIKLIIFLGNILEKKQNKLFHLFYWQAYQYYERRAFMRHRSLIKKGGSKK